MRAGDAAGYVIASFSSHSLVWSEAKSKTTGFFTGDLDHFRASGGK
jgi:hypothetical protein